MLDQKLINLTLDSMTEGSDIVDYRVEARAFLHDLLMETPPVAWKLVLPVGRALLRFPDWRETITPQSVLQFCLPRLLATMVLAPLRTDDCDPEAEYLAGLVHCYRDRIAVT